MSRAATNAGQLKEEQIFGDLPRECRFYGSWEQTGDGTPYAVEI